MAMGSSIDLALAAMNITEADRKNRRNTWLQVIPLTRNWQTVLKTDRTSSGSLSCADLRFVFPLFLYLSLKLLMIATTGNIYNVKLYNRQRE